LKRKEKWQEKDDPYQTVGNSGQYEIDESLSAQTYLSYLQVDPNQTKQTNINREIPSIEECHAPQYQSGQPEFPICKPAADFPFGPNSF
jgi:hypothetical protein